MSLLQWTDAGFLAQLDRAFADSARRSGPHLLCRAACNQCCTGIFAISMLDMVRLQRGFDLLCETDPLRASRVRDRVSAYRARLGADYPGEPVSGLLSTDKASERDSRTLQTRKYARYWTHGPEPATCTRRVL